MDNIETKHTRIVALELKSFDDATGEFSGYGAVFGNTDSYGDVVVKGAFSEFLSANKPESVKMLWQHDASQPIGVYKEMYEDSVGLFVRGVLLINEIEKAKEAYALLKAGAINGLSIGFSINPDGANYNADGIRLLTNLKLWELSVVTFPANPQANVQGVKAAPENVRDFENFLRESGGFSKAQAAEIASHGFKQGIRREAELQDEHLAKEIREILSTLKWS